MNNWVICGRFDIIWGIVFRFWWRNLAWNLSHSWRQFVGWPSLGTFLINYFANQVLLGSIGRARRRICNRIKARIWLHLFQNWATSVLSKFKTTWIYWSRLCYLLQNRFFFVPVNQIYKSYLFLEVDLIFGRLHFTSKFGFHSVIERKQLLLKEISG